MEEKNLPTTQSLETGLNIFGSIADFEAGQRIAKVFSESNLAPAAFRKNIGDCMIALNMATRMKADPLMVMQNLAIVHGTPSFEAKFLIACFNQTGKFSPIRYEEVGKPDSDDWGFRAYAIDRSTGEMCKGPLVTIKVAKAEGWYGQNPKWRNVPELMLRYRAASWFIRTIDPGVAMGFQTREEVEDIEYADFTEVDNGADVQQEIADNANAETLDIPEVGDAAADAQAAPEPTPAPATPSTGKRSYQKGAAPMSEQPEPDFFSQQ